MYECVRAVQNSNTKIRAASNKYHCCCKYALKIISGAYVKSRKPTGTLTVEKRALQFIGSTGIARPPQQSLCSNDVHSHKQHYRIPPPLHHFLTSWIIPIIPCVECQQNQFQVTSNWSLLGKNPVTCGKSCNDGRELQHANMADLNPTKNSAVKPTGSAGYCIQLTLTCFHFHRLLFRRSSLSTFHFIHGVGNKKHCFTQCISWESSFSPQPAEVTLACVLIKRNCSSVSCSNPAIVTCLRIISSTMSTFRMQYSAVSRSPSD